jgi:hypothetical protein
VVLSARTLFQSALDALRASPAPLTAREMMTDAAAARALTKLLPDPSTHALMAYLVCRPRMSS